MRSTKICFLASLMVLMTINQRFRDGPGNNWTFFDKRTTNAESFITNCFQSITTSLKRRGQQHAFMTVAFLRLMNRFNIALQDTAIFNNVFKSLTQLYTINFKNNIVVHAKTRLRALLKLKCIKNNINISDKQVKTAIKNTVQFMFNPNSRCGRDANFINLILRYIPNRNIVHEIGDTGTRGFMSRFIKWNWFECIPLFIKIQREIAEYQSQCHRNSLKIEVRNFKVVPIHSHRRKHIRIDNTTFKFILQHLKIHPTKTNHKTGRKVTLDAHEFNNALDSTAHYNPYWFQFLNWKKIRSIQRQNKKFNYQLVTDGVSVSIEFQRLNIEPAPPSFQELVEQQSAKYKLFAQRLANQAYDVIIGLDPGYKLFIAAVLKNIRTNEEKHIKISSKQFYAMTRQHCRDKKAKKAYSHFETAAKLDRENTNLYEEYPSSLTANYMNYIEHRMKFFNDGIQVYTTRKYTRLHLDKYICTQKALDEIVQLLTSSSSGRILLCIGGTEFNPNAPIKKYKRCPGTRKTVSYIKKIINCDLVFVDEYNTSQVCGKCQHPFNKLKHERWTYKGIRHRLCETCKPNNNIVALPTTIVTPICSRPLKFEMLQKTVDVFLQSPDKTYDEAKKEIKQVYGNQTNYKTFNQLNIQTQSKCVWNRDISAARNIIIKAICLLTEQPLPPSLRRGHTPEDDDENTTTN